MTLTAPYNFVPLSEHIAISGEVCADLTHLPSQDNPQPGGSESGVFDVVMTAHGRLLVSQTTKPGEAKRFFRDPDLDPALPGSSWRGAIRNVLEIATFGRMNLVDDQRTGMRDLNAVTDYRSHFSEDIRPRVYKSKAFAGWLEYKGSKVTLSPCEYARVDYRDVLGRLSVDNKGKTFRDRIEDAIDDHKAKKIPWEKPGQTPRATDTTIAETVQRIFLEGVDVTLTPRLWVEDTEQDHPHDGKKLHYRKASDDTGDLLGGVWAEQTGTLVFTGMPSGSKHMEFFFFDKKAALPLDRKILNLFLAVNEEQEKESPTWAWRKSDFYDGKPIPVFYIKNDAGGIRQIGLSMMFKMAGDNSVHDLVRNTNPLHVAEADTAIDLASRIFGRIGAKGRSNTATDAAAFRSRVSFGWAKVVANTWREVQELKVHLQKPKVGYFPAYVRQVDFAGVDGRDLVKLRGNSPADYRSYMNWKDQPKAGETIRGWKRYPVQNDPPSPVESGEAPPLVPLIAKHGQTLRFTAKLRYHNLHPIELGALIWAVTFGENAALRHSIGMGRPLGCGQVSIAAQLDDGHKAALKAFTDAMEAWAGQKDIKGGWAGSLQIRQLTAMADPVAGKQNRGALAQMVLDPDKRKNGFLDAKKAGDVLPEYGLGDLSEWWAGPDAATVKGLAEFKEGLGRDDVRTVLKEARRVFDAKRAGRMKETEERANAEAGKGKAAMNAGEFPVGTRVTVRGKPGVRLVVAWFSKGFRMVSRNEDGTGSPEKTNASLLTLAP